jgi:hypothetical protein
MAQPLLPDRTHDPQRIVCTTPADGASDDMADLKIFWGPEICRLEYLVHLLETGRVKDEHWPRTA